MSTLSWPSLWLFHGLRSFFQVTPEGRQRELRAQVLKGPFPHCEGMTGSALLLTGFP